MSKIAIVGASGKLGFATLQALLDLGLAAPDNIVCTTSSQSGAERLESAKKRGVLIRSAHFDDEESFVQAFQGVERIFLISSARVHLDFNDAPPGEGREADHYCVLAAAEKSGVKHVYYASLAFADPSLSRVMKAHERTEEFIRSSRFTWTLIREGLYSESWPLYLGHFHVPDDDRSEVVVAGDSRINWTSITDLGMANALILSAPTHEWAGKTFYLSQAAAHSLEDVAAMVAEASGKKTQLKIVSRQEHEDYYIKQRGMDKYFIKWWSKTYDALRQNECLISDGTLEKLLASQGMRPKPMERTVTMMFQHQP